MVPIIIRKVKKNNGNEAFISKDQLIKYGSGKLMILAIRPTIGPTKVLNFVSKASFEIVKYIEVLDLLKIVVIADNQEKAFILDEYT
jgi:hypothetical protein